MKLSEKTIKSNLVYDGKIFKVYSDDVMLVDGKRTKRDKVVHNGGVCVIVKDKDNKFILVEQYRYGVSEVTFELIAGKLEKNENPKDCAIREAEEEAGIKAKEVEDFGKIYPTPAYDSEIIYCYIIKDFENSKQKLDPGEFVNIKRFSREEIVENIENGKIVDGKTVAFLTRYLLKNEKSFANILK